MCCGTSERFGAEAAESGEKITAAINPRWPGQASPIELRCLLPNNIHIILTVMYVPVKDVQTAVKLGWVPY